MVAGLVCVGEIEESLMFKMRRCSGLGSLSATKSWHFTILELHSSVNNFRMYGDSTASFVP